MTGVLQRMRGAWSRTGDEAGFTMVEMMMAIFIFAIVILGVAVGMASSLNLTRQNRNRSIAANLASQNMDTIRSMDFADLDNMTQLTQPTTSTTSVEGVPYTLSQTTRWVRKNEAGSTPGPCQSPPTSANPLAYIAVTTSVSWADMHGVPPVASSTVVTPPVGIYDQTAGHIAVTVLTAAAQPVQGVTVSIAGPGVAGSAPTSSDGCAFFAFQPVGAYTITLSSGTGKVDGQGSTSPAQTTTVKAASTSSVQFLYDTAATLSLTLTPTVGGYSVPSTVPVSLANTHLLPAGVIAYPGSGSPRTISNLFPYTDGYEAWAGSCSDADPQGVNPATGVAYYSGASREAATSMTPGQTSADTVILPSLQLLYMRSSGTATYTITATHVVPPGNASDPGCSTGQVYTLTSTLSVSTTQTAVNVSMPFGTWTIKWKNNGSSANGSQNVTLSPLNANNPLTTSVVTVT